MATTLSRIYPYTGLCRYCLNYTKVQNYVEDTYEQEGIEVYRCSAIPDLKFEDITTSAIDADSLTLLTADTNISNCNRFLAGAIVTVTNVAYDAGTTTLTIDYTVYGAVGTPDINFYFVGTAGSIGTVATITDGAGTINIVTGLSDGNYYLYANLTTTEMSVIYPFRLTTT